MMVCARMRGGDISRSNRWTLQNPLQIGDDGARQKLCPFRLGSRELLIDSLHEQRKPVVKILGVNGVPSMDLAMHVNHVVAVARAAEQQPLPVGFDDGHLLGQTRSIKKLSQARVPQYLRVKPGDQRLDGCRGVEVGLLRNGQLHGDGH